MYRASTVIGGLMGCIMGTTDTMPCLERRDYRSVEWMR